MKKNLMIVLEKELIEECRSIAVRESRSLNGQIKYFLENSVVNWKLNSEKIWEHSKDYEKEEGANK